MPRTSVNTGQIRDNNVSRDDLHVAAGDAQSVITKLVEIANSGIKINSSTIPAGGAAPAGTGDVGLQIDTAYLNTLYQQVLSGGINNRVAKWTSATNLGNSTITDDGTNVSISGTFTSGNDISGVGFGGGGTNISQLNSTFIDLHPESGSQTILPFLSNDIAYNRLRGGSTIATLNGVAYTLTNAQIDGLFDGSPYYSIFDSTTWSGKTFVLETTFYNANKFSYASKVGISFGNLTWRAQTILVEGYRTDINGWATIGSVTNWSKPNYAVATDTGRYYLTKLRFTLSNFTSFSGSGFRIGQIFAYSYNSILAKEVFLGRDGGSLYGNITSTASITATSFIGAGDSLTGNATGLSIGGNAATASAVSWSGITSKPTTISGFGITDAYTKTEISNSTSLQIAQHIYRNAYDVNGNVYDHYYPSGGFGTVTSTANLRVWNGAGGFKLLQFSGSGQFYWDGNTVLTSANYNTYAPTKTGTGASGSWGISITGNAATATTATSATTASSSPLLSALNSYVWTAATLPSSYQMGIQTSFVGPGSTEGSFVEYGSILNMKTYSGGGGTLQMYVPYSPSHGGGNIKVRFGNYDVSSGNSWTGWTTLANKEELPALYQPLENQRLSTTNSPTFAALAANGGVSSTYGFQFYIPSGTNWSIYSPGDVNLYLRDLTAAQMIYTISPYSTNSIRFHRTLYAEGDLNLDGTNTTKGYMYVGNGTSDTSGIVVNRLSGGYTQYSKGDTPIAFVGSSNAALDDGSNDSVFYTYNGNKFHVSTGGAKSLTVDGTGKVGIGTTSPLTALAINAPSGTESGLLVKGGVYNTGNYGGAVYFSNTTLDPTLAGASIKFGLTYAGSVENGWLGFYTGQTQRMIIDQNGDISDYGTFTIGGRYFANGHARTALNVIGDMWVGDYNSSRTINLEGDIKFRLLDGVISAVKSNNLDSLNGGVTLQYTTAGSLTDGFVLDSNGNVTVAGAIQASGYSKITATSGAQRMLIGNQDSAGVNRPSLISAANGTLGFGFGNTWGGNGGAMTTNASLDTLGNFSVTGYVNATDYLVSGASITTAKMTLGSKYLINSYQAMAGEAPGDMGMSGLFDRNELTNAAVRGNVTVTITGAGSVDQYQINAMFDGSGSFGTISGTDNTTTKIVILVDLLTNQPNYSRGLWQPFIQYRINAGSSATYYSNVTFEVSTDNSTWYTGPGWQTANFAGEQAIPGLWMGQETGYSPAATYRYVRITLQNRVENAADPYKAYLWIGEIGYRHISAPYARQYMLSSGDTMYGKLQVGRIGQVSITPGTATETGYMGFFKPDATTRIGYIGYDTSNMYYNAENGAKHIFMGNYVGIGTSPTSEFHVYSSRASGLDPYFLIQGGKLPGQASSVAFQRSDSNKQMLFSFETGNSGNPDGYFGTIGGVSGNIYMLSRFGNSTVAVGVDQINGFVIGTGSNITSAYAARITATGDAYFASVTTQALSLPANMPTFGPASNNPETGKWNPLWTAIAAGKPLYDDEEFASGTNSVFAYNNAGGTGVVITRGADASAPNSSGFVLTITHNGAATTPGFGGFVQNIYSARNRTFVQRFRAKLPVGYTFNLTENQQGTNNTSYWLTSQDGTGKWEEYVRVSHCGNTGTFSSGGHVYVTGATATFTWYLASCNIYDVEAPLSTVYQPKEDQRLSTTNDVRFRDITANRGDGTGVVYLGNPDKYLYYDGNNYVMPYANLYVNGNPVWTQATLSNNNQLTNGAGYITSAQTYYIGTTPMALNRASGAGTLTGVSIDGSAGSVAWAGVTSKPTTVAGYGITDFNSLGDARWALINQNHYIGTTAVAINRASGALALTGVSIDGSAGSVAWSGITSKPTTVSGYGITDAYKIGQGSVSDINAALTTGQYFWGGSATNQPVAGQYGTLLNFVNDGGTQNATSNWLNQLAFSTNGGIWFRQKINTTAFTSWQTLITSTNFSSYSPGLTGSGASGTWAINVTGTASSSNYASNAGTWNGQPYSATNIGTPTYAMMYEASSSTWKYATAAQVQSWLGISSTVAWSSVTGKPTTISGYGITDFNSSGDARWASIGQVHYVGTTPIAINRGSAAQTLTGVSIDGNAGSVTNGVYTSGDQSISGLKTFSNNLTGGGKIISGTGQGFRNAAFNAGFNPIWSFLNAEAWGIGYYQSSLNGITGDAIGFHYGNTAAPKFRVYDSGNVYTDGTLNTQGLIATAGNFNGQNVWFSAGDSYSNLPSGAVAIGLGCPSGSLSSSAITFWGDGIQVMPNSYSSGSGAPIFTVSKTGNVVASGSIVSRADVASARHLVANGPVITASTTGNTGSGSTVSVTNCTDIAGKLFLTTGTGTLSGGQQLVVNFATAYSNVPVVVMTLGNGVSINQNIYISSITTSGFVVSSNTALTASSNYTFYYHAIDTSSVSP